MLPPDTAKVWEFLNGHALLKGFVLVGGTGLALRIQHRLSEDLDFCFNGLRLPRRRLEALVLDAEPHGITFRENDSPSAWEEFERVDMDLNDYQQDYIVNGSVKVTFFTADSPLSKILPVDEEADMRVASMEELFASKAIVSAQRSKSRDWFDLYFLIQSGDFNLRDYLAAFEKAGIANQWESGLARIISGRLSPSDEGYLQLVVGAPEVSELTEFFQEKRDQLEIELAKERANS